MSPETPMGGSTFPLLPRRFTYRVVRIGNKWAAQSGSYRVVIPKIPHTCPYALNLLTRPDLSDWGLYSHITADAAMAAYLTDTPLPDWAFQEAVTGVEATIGQRLDAAMEAERKRRAEEVCRREQVGGMDGDQVPGAGPG